jgi:DNA-binding phage protein
MDMAVFADRITASAETLMKQAALTADYYLSQAIEDIDNRLGEGFAGKHPELIAAYMQAAAADCSAAIVAKQIRLGFEGLAVALSQTFDGIAED